VIISFIRLLRNATTRSGAWSALSIGLSEASDGQLSGNNNQGLASPVRGFA
jgi:hypothetical protein